MGLKLRMLKLATTSLCHLYAITEVVKKPNPTNQPQGTSSYLQDFRGGTNGKVLTTAGWGDVFIPCGFAQSYALKEAWPPPVKMVSWILPVLTLVYSVFSTEISRADIPVCCSMAVSALKYTKHYSLFQDYTQKETNVTLWIERVSPFSMFSPHSFFTLSTSFNYFVP